MFRLCSVIGCPCPFARQPRPAKPLRSKPHPRSAIAPLGFSVGRLGFSVIEYVVSNSVDPMSHSSITKLYLTARNINNSQADSGDTEEFE